MIKEIEKYKAVAEEIRLRILRLLLYAETELCACELIDVLNRPQYNISKNLSILKKVELIEERREGKLMMFGIKNDNEFNRKLFDNITTIDPDSNPAFQDDYIKLDKRLALRVNGEVVVTYKK